VWKYFITDFGTCIGKLAGRPNTQGPNRVDSLTDSNCMKLAGR
jgi:hypothetical protein